MRPRNRSYRLPFVGDDEARFRKARVIVVFEGGAQRLPRIRREAEREARGGLAGQAASLQVFDRGLAGLQLLAVELRRLRQHLGERPRLRLRLACARGLLGHLHAGHLREFADGVHVAEAAVLHQEADRAAVRAASETVEELLRRTDRERRRLLAVEGTEPEEVLPGLLQLDVAADDIGDVDAREQVLDEALGNHDGRRKCTHRPCRRSRTQVDSIERAPIGAAPRRTARRPGSVTQGAVSPARRPCPCRPGRRCAASAPP